MGKSEDDSEVEAARSLIPTSGPAAEILAQQADGGYWKYQRHYYSPKYTSSHWSMLLLCELAVDPDHSAMQAGSYHMLRTVEKDVRAYQQGEKTGWGCLWGNWLRYQLYCGKLQDERVQEVIHILSKDVQQRCACLYNDGLPCAWGVARGLFGLALIPLDLQTSEVHEAIHMGIDFLANEFRLEAGDYPYIKKIHPTWSQLSFPLFYHADTLFVLRVLKEFNAHHLPGVRNARKQLAARRTNAGIWRGSSPFRSRTWPFMTEGDSLSRWLTLQVLDVLT